MWAKLQPKEGQPGPGAPLPLQAAPSRSGEDVGREFKRSRREQRAEIEAGSMGERSQVEGQGGRGRHRLPREGRKEKESKNKGKEKRKESQEPESGGKAMAKKKVADLYTGTGLDPDPKARRRIKRKAKKKLKKSKTSSSSSSQSSESSSSVEGDLGLLQDRNKVQLLAEVAPGVLTEESLQHMKTHVLQASGSTWAMDSDSLPPIVSQYMRSHIAPRASGGILREVVTIAHALDLLLQARPAEAADTLSQRLKSLELTISGQPWATSQKIEVVPQLEATMASRAEVQVAQKEARLDVQAKGPSASWDKGKTKGKGKDKDKGKEKGKGGKTRDEGKKSS